MDPPKPPPAGPLDRYTDEELLRLHRTRSDERALATLFRRYSHKVLGLCISYLKNHEDGEDAAMEVFENLCRKLDQYEIKNFSTWLFYVTRNHCLKRLQYKLRLRLQDISEISPDLFVEKASESDHYTEARLEKLSDAIDDLKEEQRRCVVMFFLEQRSYKEIADRTAYSLNEVKSYIQNGKRNLKNALI